MRNEALLGALTHPDVRAIVQQQREAHAHASGGQSIEGEASSVTAEAQTTRRSELAARRIDDIPGAAAPAAAAKRRGMTVGTKGKVAPHVSTNGGKPAADLAGMIEATGYTVGSQLGSWWGRGRGKGISSAVVRFREFLAHYSRVTDDELKAEVSNRYGLWTHLIPFRLLCCGPLFVCDKMPVYKCQI
jgi:hypothetical protein